jgi:hypothetical protein
LFIILLHKIIKLQILYYLFKLNNNIPNLINKAIYLEIT